MLNPQQNLAIHVNEQHTVLIFVYEGEVTTGDIKQALKAGQLVQLIDGNELCVQTQNQVARFLLLASMPLKEPVVQSEPFVLNNQEEIEQTFRDYRDGLLTL